MASVNRILLDVVGSSDNARRHLQATADEIRALPNSATVAVAVETRRADAQLTEMRRKLRDIDRSRVSPEVNVKISKALAQIEVLQARLRSLPKNSSLDFSTRGNLLGQIAGIESSVFGLTKGLTDAADGGSVFGDSMGRAAQMLKSLTPILSGLAILLGITLVSAIGALVASFAAAVGGIAALASAFLAVLGPAVMFIIALFQRIAAVMGAKKAQDAAAKQATIGAGKAARDAAGDHERERAAAIAVRDAKEGLARAQRDYAQAVIQARQKIKDAAQEEQKDHRAVIEAVHDRKKAYDDLARARTDAQQAITDAASREQDAQRQLTRAEADGFVQVMQAQQKLDDAQANVAEQSTKALEDQAKATRDLRDAQLDLESAQLGVEDAADGVADKLRDIEKLKAQIGSKPLLQGLGDVNIDPSIAQKLVADASAAGSISPDLAEKLKDAYRELAHAKLDVQKADATLSDAENGLKTAQDQVNSYTRDGINAYEPYRQAVKDAAQAQLDLAAAQVDSKERVDDARRAHVEAAAALTELQRIGVAGAPGVVSAEEQVHNAAQRVTEARRTERDAEKELAALRAQGIRQSPEVLNAADSLRNAHQQLAEAQHQVAIAGQKAATAMGGGGSAAAGAAFEVGKLSGAEKDLLGALRLVGKVWREVMQPGTDTVISAMADGIRALLPLLRSMEPMFTAFGTVLAQGIGSAVKALRDPAWSSFFRDIAAALPIVARDGLRAFGGLAVIFRNIAQASLPFLVKAFKAVADALTGWGDKTSNISGLQRIIGMLVHSTKAWFDLFGALAGLFGQFIADVAPLGDGLVKWLADGARSLERWMASARGSKDLQRFFADTLPLAKAMVVFVARLAIVFMQLVQFLAPAFTSIINGLNALLGGLSFILNLANRIPPPLKDILGTLLLFFLPIGKAQKAFELFGSEVVIGGRAVIAALVAIGEFFGSLPGKIVDAVKGGAGVFKDAGGWVVDKIVDGVKDAAGAVAGAASWLLDKYVGYVKGMAGRWLNAGEWVIGTIADGITTAVGAITGFGGWLVDRIKNALERSAAFYVNRGQDVIGWIADGLQTIGTNLAGFATWLAERLKNALIAGAEFFRNRGQDVIGWIGQGVMTLGDALKGFGGWLSDRVGNAAQGAWDGVKGAGTEILHRLIDGLLHAPAAVFDRLKGFADLIVKKVRHFLGINSPSKRFMEIGGHLADGLIRGFMDLDVMDFIRGALGGVKNLAKDMALKPLKEAAKGVKGLKGLIGLASGGLVTGPTLAAVGEGAYHEAVLPLSQAVFRELAAGITDQLQMAMPTMSTPAGLAPQLQGAGGDTYNINLPPSAPAAPQPDPVLAAAGMAAELRRRGGLPG